MSRKPVNPSRERLDFGDDDSATPILHIDMDAFYASVELISRPELVGKPVIIGGREGRGVVLSATYEARALGVHAAMPMSTAKRLAPNAVVIAPSHHLYSQVSDGVMAIFRDITPAVEPLSLDEAFLDVSGAVRRLGSPLAIARLIRERVREEQRITSTYIKPDGLLLVPPERVIDFLHPLPVGALWGVGPKTEEQLHRLGLRTVKDVAHTPEQTLRRALGEAMGSHLAALAWGADEREVRNRTSRRSPSAATPPSTTTATIPITCCRGCLSSARASRGACGERGWWRRPWSCACASPTSRPSAARASCRSRSTPGMSCSRRRRRSSRG